LGEDPLALETRRRIYLAVQRSPGQSAREIQRRAGTAWGETAYHLERLEEAGLVHRDRGPHQDFYFAHTVPALDRPLLRLARSGAVRRILVELLRATDQTLPELAERCDLSLSRVSIHLRRLLATGLVVTGRRGAFRTFRVAEPGRVARVLSTWKETYGDRWIERLVDSWSELFPP
jgi:predicted transcriptional regulator